MCPDQGVVNPSLSTHPTITNVITADKLTSYLHPHLTLSWLLIGQMYKYLPLIGQGYTLLTRADLYITVHQSFMQYDIVANVCVRLNSDKCDLNLSHYHNPTLQTPNI